MSMHTEILAESAFNNACRSKRYEASKLSALQRGDYRKAVYYDNMAEIKRMECIRNAESLMGELERG